MTEPLWAFVGASRLDRTSADAFLASACGDQDDWASRPVAPLIQYFHDICAAALTMQEGDELPETFQAQARDLALGAQLNENEKLARGDCLRPALDDGDIIKIDLAAFVRPGDIAGIVWNHGLFGKYAMYVGRMHAGVPWATGAWAFEQYAPRQPRYIEVFYQAEPECLMGIADFDLVGAWRVVSRRSGSEESKSFGRWELDIRTRPEFSELLAVVTGTPIPPARQSMNDAIVYTVASFIVELLALKKREG